MPKSKDFFSEAEKQRIEAAVRAVEKSTSGEVVPMVVDQSYDYPQAEIVGAGSFALASASLLSWYFGGASVWVFLAGFFPLYFLLKALIRNTPALKRRLVHPAEITAEVEEKAMVAFLEQGLHHTRDETGILILISLFEHRVYVLADRGINNVVPLHTWDEIVQTVTTGIHEGRACDALCTAIGRCGALLEGHFPAKHDDTNELPNLIV
ncbi:MAG TPA: TPM domain-containing protein [Desulfuromonadales bacterium]|nr:TPM domain-containing protein [Desulfuromonadales bacterium]